MKRTGLSKTNPLHLAVLSGTVTALVSAVAYFLYPLATSEYVGNAGGEDSLDVASYVLEFFFSVSPLYHVGVLVLVPFATTAITLTLARRGGHVGRSTDEAVVIAVVAGPVVMVWVGAYVALVAIAIQALAIAIYGAVVAFAIALVLSAVVAIPVTVGAVGGYVLVERVGTTAPE